MTFLVGIEVIFTSQSSKSLRRLFESYDTIEQTVCTECHMRVMNQDHASSGVTKHITITN